MYHARLELPVTCTKFPLTLKLVNLWSPRLNSYIASFSGFLITGSMHKWREKAWGISVRDLRHSRHMSSCLCWLCTKTGQAPAKSYTECMKHTKAILQRVAEWQSWKYPASNHLENMHNLDLHCLYHSHLSMVKLRIWICFTGRRSTSTCFHSLASL